MTERALLQLIRRLASPSAGLRLGPGDDCAIWRPRPGYEVLITTDQLIAGVHYLKDRISAPRAAARLMGRGLSDIAAMGGEPRLAFLNLALPPDHSGRWVTGFLRGFAAAARLYQVAWAGGDVSSVSGPAVISITVIGEVPRGQAMTRSGARPGDRIYVTGKLGGIRSSITPRLEAGRFLRSRKLATAAMDLSDGLSTDLNRLCQESRVGALVRAGALPSAGTLEQALNRGEDYELLFTARSKTKIPRSISGVRITEIGRITRSRRVLLDRRPLRPGGWEHFRNRG